MICVKKKRAVYPATPSQRQQIRLSPLDLPMLFFHYIQKGLLYQTPTDNFSSRVDFLAEKLSVLLVKFYPLAGRFKTSPSDGALYIDCNDSGVDFIEASAADLSIADVSTPEVTHAVEQLFALNGAVNFDGHRLPLLAVQVTELRDGISVCCTVNHVVADGTSFWHFFNSWAHLCMTNGNQIPNNPIHDPSLVNPGGSVIKLGLDPEGNFPQLCPPPMRIKFFHFSAHTIRCLKERANRDSAAVISSFQALCGHVWRAVTRARGLDPNEPTTFRMAANCRPRFTPPLPNLCFGNTIQVICTTTTVRELNTLPLSFAAGLLNATIAGLRDGVIREKIGMWEKEPVINRLPLVNIEKNCLLMSSSPRFDMYENDFGWGRAVAVRSGMANRFDGKVFAYPGKEGGGSVDLEICLLPHFMNALESDLHFISSPSD